MGQFRVNVRDICSNRREDALVTIQSLWWVCDPWPHHRVPSPSIWELSLSLSSMSGMLTRNCRWSRRMSRVRVPSICSMSCWVSARDMSPLATPLIWREQSKRPHWGKLPPAEAPLKQDAPSAFFPVPTGFLGLYPSRLLWKSQQPPVCFAHVCKGSDNFPLLPSLQIL